MSKAADIEAKAARLKARASVPTDRRTAVPTDSSTPVATDRSPVRIRPVRITVDIPPADHAALAQWCLSAAHDIGIPRVHGQELLRALLRRALDDPSLRNQIAADVAQQRALRA